MGSSIFVLGSCPLLSRWVLLKIIYRLANSVDPDETAHDEQSHLDLHCLHWYLYRSIGQRGLTHFKLIKLLHTIDRKNPISILGMPGYVTELFLEK